MLTMASARRGPSSASSAVLVAALLLVARTASTGPAGDEGDEGGLSGQGGQGGIYFPLRSVELKLWVDGKSGKLLPPPGGVLLAPQLLGDAGSPETASITFRLTDPARPGQPPALPWLSVDAKTGVLKVTEEHVLGDQGARRQHAVWLEARGPASLRAPPPRSARPFMVTAERARANVTITFEVLQEDRPCVNKGDQSAPAARDDPCHYCHDSCFWQSAELQVWENKPAARLAPLGHTYDGLHCGEGHQYRLKNGTEHFEIRGGDLWARGQLDRDAQGDAGAARRGPGPRAPLSVECRAPWGVEESVVAVFVLDEDDNAPELQKDEKLEFNFSTEAALSRGAHVLVKDLDSRAANRFAELQVADASGAVAHKKLEFDVTHGGVPHTLISIRLQVKDPMEAHYRVGLTLTDITLAGPEDKKDLRMNVTLWGPPVTPPVAMSSNGTSGDDAGGASPKRLARAALEGGVAAADEKPARLWRHAATFARVRQVGEAGDGKHYRLAEPSPWAGVTKKAGIVFVADPQQLQRLQRPGDTLVVLAVSPEGQTQHTLRVELVSQKGPNCQLADRQNCSQYKKREACERGCGVGSGGPDSGPQGGCAWREGPRTANVTSRYSTCSVGLATCPDTVCDPLEELDANICPQDCTGTLYIGVPCQSGSPTVGMCRCAGVGWCNGDHCQCEVMTSPGKSAKRKGERKSVPDGGADRPGPGPAPQEHEACGVACQGAIMAVILVSVAIAALYAGCQRRARSKRAVLADRGDPQLGAQLEVLRHQDAAPRRPADVHPRWEVDRQRLLLHEEIGAGEFGRVLRGTLTLEDHTTVTVAVKTPRAAGGWSEASDLLSELELLKDVDHPNVVRLLGACTDPHGPLYVLLEHCGQGSLRDYLHRCRWTDDDDPVQDAVKDLVKEPLKGSVERPTMTPRKIIGFAWQIAKGMDYLGQLKLVHRDLASRNILLSESLVCKISDFGLSRDVYVDEAYCKLSAGKVPVKWMAPESLLLRVYTSKSDVWAFGVLLWELCTLGGAPYAGVSPHDMLAMLASGQRLARPEHCSRELYRLMQGCWQPEPQERPHFSQLVAILDGMLARGSGYLDLDARMVTNPAYFEEQGGQLQLACSPCAEGYLLPQRTPREGPQYENTVVT